MQKVHFIQQEARRQGKRVYRIDIDFKNAFNTMCQAALWRVMRMFKIPDVDLLEQIYEGVTVRLAPNDEESATITFNTGVAQGSITSPQLVNIFINALLCMLTVTGQNEDISHGLQIGKDQKGDKYHTEYNHSQRHGHGSSALTGAIRACVRRDTRIKCDTRIICAQLGFDTLITQLMVQGMAQHISFECLQFSCPCRPHSSPLLCICSGRLSV